MKAVVFESTPEINGFVEKLLIFFLVNDIMKLVQALIDSDILIKIKQLKMKQKNKREDF